MTDQQLIRAYDAARTAQAAAEATREELATQLRERVTLSSDGQVRSSIGFAYLDSTARVDYNDPAFQAAIKRAGIEAPKKPVSRLQCIMLTKPRKRTAVKGVLDVAAVHDAVESLSRLEESMRQTQQAQQQGAWTR